MITISFYSYKGGVGRSLTLTNLAVYLTQFGARVAMIDLDLEAPGLHYKLQPGQAPVEPTTSGIAGLLATVSRGALPSQVDYDLDIDVTHYAAGVPSTESFVDQPQGRLLLLPAGDPLDTNYWRDVAAIDWAGLFESPGRPGVTTMSRLRQRLIDKHDPDVLLVDSRTGVTASAGIATTLLPDVVVAFLLKTAEHLDGSRVVISSIVTAGAGSSGGPPRVVPVLSRYTSKTINEALSGDLAAPARTARRGSRDFRPRLLRSEENPLEGIRQCLVQGLPEDLAAYVDQPLALHADLALQHEESLRFGPHAQDVAGGIGGEALLDDYLRLFANLVPKEIVTRYLSGVRNKVRAIILDRPDDAVRTLENLASLVGDEEVFIDLVKVYLLRRDTRSVILAANKLFRVHGRIVVDSAITASLRDILTRGFHRRTGVEGLELDPRFVESYWRAADPDDMSFGAGVVRFLATQGETALANDIAEELLATTPDAKLLRELVDMLAAGDDACERLAVRLATEHFALGSASPEFLVRAAIASRYQRDKVLARLIVEAPAFEMSESSLTIEMLLLAGRTEQAGIQAVEALARLDPYDANLEDYSRVWFTVIARNRELRGEVESRNPAVVDMLESTSQERHERTRRSW